MKITIARLRGGSNYTRPLYDIMDSFYYLYKRYMDENTNHTYGFYNQGFGFANRRKMDDIIDSDIIIIPSENEFTFHIKNVQDRRQLERTKLSNKEIGKHLKDKHIIIMKSDRADDEKLYREKTFKDFDIGKISILDEMDISGGVHGMKYHFLKELNNNISNEKQYDFIYWGTDKRKTSDNKESGDVRHTYLKKIYKDKKIDSYWIGKFSGIKRDMKIQKKMIHIVPYLNKSKSTLCFNWMSKTATTSRYHESLGCGILPFVHMDYDVNNTLVADEWQRITEVDELYKKLEDPKFSKKYEDIEQYYIKNTVKTKNEYYELFKNRLDTLINL